jgi:hypothetical protein
MHERFAGSHGEPFDMELERARNGYEKYLRALAAAITRQADPGRRDQLEMQFNDVASEIEFAVASGRDEIPQCRRRQGLSDPSIPPTVPPML